MADFDDLTEAFSELERRADTASAHRSPNSVTTRGKRQAPQFVLVAAAVVAVLAVSLGVVLFAGGNDSARHGGPAAVTPPASSTSPPSPSRVPLETRTTTLVPTAARTVYPPPPAATVIPRSARELQKRFRAVLGRTATFTVKLSEDNRSAQDPFIVGVLTASGRRGGFDLQMLPMPPGARPSCDPAPVGSTGTCTRRRLADGSLLALSAVTSSGGGATYLADLITKHGINVSMHVSSESDPKGESKVLSAKPPFTQKQMEAVITSPRWFG